MTADMEAAQSQSDDSGLPGPGAPTPLSALEVRLVARHHKDLGWLTGRVF